MTPFKAKLQRVLKYLNQNLSYNFISYFDKCSCTIFHLLGASRPCSVKKYLKYNFSVDAVISILNFHFSSIKLHRGKRRRRKVKF